MIKYPVSLDECDHLILKRAIIEIDSFQFLKLLDKYRNPVTLENFIIMTIINLKDTLKEAATTLKALLNSLGKHSQNRFQFQLLITVANILSIYSNLRIFYVCVMSSTNIYFNVLNSIFVDILFSHFYYHYYYRVLNIIILRETNHIIEKS